MCKQRRHHFGWPASLAFLYILWMGKMPSEICFWLPDTFIYFWDDRLPWSPPRQLGKVPERLSCVNSQQFSFNKRPGKNRWEPFKCVRLWNDFPNGWKPLWDKLLTSPCLRENGGWAKNISSPSPLNPPLCFILVCLLSMQTKPIYTLLSSLCLPVASAFAPSIALWDIGREFGRDWSLRVCEACEMVLFIYSNKGHGPRLS